MKVTIGTPSSSFCYGYVTQTEDWGVSLGCYEWGLAEPGLSPPEIGHGWCCADSSTRSPGLGQADVALTGSHQCRDVRFDVGLSGAGATHRRPFCLSL